MTRKSKLASPDHQTLDERAAHWRELEAKAEDARAHYSAICAQNPTRLGDWLANAPATEAAYRQAVAEVPVREAEAPAAVAAHELAIALDADEVASGDELAVACDPPRLRADLVSFEEKETRLRAELEQIQRDRATRILFASVARGKLNERRRASGLPESPGMPITSLPGAYLVALDAHVRTRATPPNRQGAIDEAKATVRRLAAGLEEQKREAEEKERERERRRTSHQANDEFVQEQMQARARERAENEAAQQRRQTELAGAYAKRAGASP